MDLKQRNKRFDRIAWVMVFIGLGLQVYGILKTIGAHNKTLVLLIIGGLLSVLMLALMIAIRVSQTSTNQDSFDEKRFRIRCRNYVTALYVVQGIGIGLLILSTL